jgi:hypothetical protein
MYNPDYRRRRGWFSKFCNVTRPHPWTPSADTTIWNTVKSAHGPWRISRSPVLAIALPGSYFDGLGLPRLHRGSHR